MAQFHTLTVTDIQPTTRDAVVVTLQPENGADFSFTQGQYLTFRKEFDGEELRRSYSICSGTHDGALRVGIKRVDGGAFSTWANENLKVGERLEAMPPMGNFHAPLQPEAARHYLMIAAGSGITPILSLTKTILAEEPKADITLLYSNRAVNTVMFREELEDLKNLNMTRLNLVHVLSGGGQDIDLLSGRLDTEKCDALFEKMIDISRIDLAFICGPEEMMKTAAAALESRGLGKDAIKYELFAASQAGRAKKRAVSKVAQNAKATKATIILDGTRHTLDIAPDQSVLEAALAQSIEAPYACTAGVCSTCMARLTEGAVEMVANHALEDYEVEAGRILTCQAHPTSETITVDYDQH
ncbi:2Fe-2S iron-sulfur cluster-binding protein [Pseudahrensia aquimaris]|uniref:2Fe-2S iron-sulfur cluster-binding protein n=1 Tax=Pseudahrensia aquimaris TaxID=744461 RepID=A0ABW3FGZ1_9HYPH